MVDLIIENGNVVFPDFTIDTSLAIDDGKIVAIGSHHTMPKGEKVINAQGKLVFPGGIDPHDHTGAQGWLPGSKATSWGGTTTLINFSTGGVEGIEKLRAEVDNQIVIAGENRIGKPIFFMHYDFCWMLHWLRQLASYEKPIIGTDKITHF